MDVHSIDLSTDTGAICIDETIVESERTPGVHPGGDAFPNSSRGGYEISISNYHGRCILRLRYSPVNCGEIDETPSACCHFSLPPARDTQREWKSIGGSIRRKQ